MKKKTAHYLTLQKFGSCVNSEYCIWKYVSFFVCDLKDTASPESTISESVETNHCLLLCDVISQFLRGRKAGSSSFFPNNRHFLGVQLSTSYPSQSFL